MNPLFASLFADTVIPAVALSPNDESLINQLIAENPDEQSRTALENIREIIGTDPDDPDYVNRLKGVGDELLVKAWLEGDWDSHVGQYFSLWKENQIAVSSFKIPEHWPIFGGLDYGEAAHTSFGLYTCDYDHNVYRICEFYRDNAPASTHAYEIMKLIESCPFTDGRKPTAMYADPSMWVKRRLSEVINHSPADVFADHGLWLTRANNDRITGWRVINDALASERFYAFAG